jgi:hypothetical protein
LRPRSLQRLASSRCRCFGEAFEQGIRASAPIRIIQLGANDRPALARAPMRAVATLAANGRNAGQAAKLALPEVFALRGTTSVLTASPDHGTRNALDSRRVSVNARFEAEQ